MPFPYRVQIEKIASNTLNSLTINDLQPLHNCKLLIFNNLPLSFFTSHNPHQIYIPARQNTVAPLPACGRQASIGQCSDWERRGWGGFLPTTRTKYTFLYDKMVLRGPWSMVNSPWEKHQSTHNKSPISISQPALNIHSCTTKRLLNPFAPIHFFISPFARFYLILPNCNI